MGIDAYLGEVGSVQALGACSSESRESAHGGPARSIRGARSVAAAARRQGEQAGSVTASRIEGAQDCGASPRVSLDRSEPRRGAVSARSTSSADRWPEMMPRWSRRLRLARAVPPRLDRSHRGRAWRFRRRCTAEQPGCGAEPTLYRSCRHHRRSRRSSPEGPIPTSADTQAERVPRAVNAAPLARPGGELQRPSDRPRLLACRTFMHRARRRRRRQRCCAAGRVRRRGS
jgi:hypothetical protein